LRLQDIFYRFFPLIADVKKATTLAPMPASNVVLSAATKATGFAVVGLTPESPV
jgi:hypothetical protein